MYSEENHERTVFNKADNVSTRRSQKYVHQGLFETGIDRNVLEREFSVKSCNERNGIAKKCGTMLLFLMKM